MKKLPLVFDNCHTCPYSIIEPFLRGMYICKLTEKTLGISLTDLGNRMLDSCPLEDVKPEGAT